LSPCHDDASQFASAAPLPKGRVRRKGGGRRHLSSRDTTLIEDLRNVIEPATLGDPMRPLLWVCENNELRTYCIRDVVPSATIRVPIK
jgi:hypothetical protein